MRVRSSGELFHAFLGVARRYGEKILNGERVPLAGRVLYALGELLIYGPLKNVLGLSRVRIAYTAGEAIGPDLFSFLSLDRAEPEAALRPDRSLPLSHRAAGREDLRRHRRAAMTNVDLRIADSGEVLFKSPGMFVGYFKDDGQDRRGHDRGRLCQDRRRRLHRSQDRPSQDHRPRQGRRPAQRRLVVRAEIHREQAQILSQHPRSGGARRQARLRLRDAEHRPRARSGAGPSATTSSTAPIRSWPAIRWSTTCSPATWRK